MADEKPAIRIGLIEMIIGIVAVVIAIAIVTVANAALTLGLPEWAMSAIGAVIGVVAWFLFLKSRKA